MIATFLLPQELGPCSTQATFGRSLLKTTNDPTLFPCEKGSNGIGRDQKPVLLVLLGRHEPPFVSRKMVLYPIFVAPSVSFCTTYCIWVIYIYYINSTMEMSLVDGSAMYIYIYLLLVTLQLNTGKNAACLKGRNVGPWFPVGKTMPVLPPRQWYVYIP
jgi:hypothetical protein